MIWINISAITLIFLATMQFMSAGKAKTSGDGFLHLLLGAWFLLCDVMLFVKC